MIKITNLTKYFGDKLAVDDISFEVKKGEVLAFIGTNGAGKSTTMRMATGFIPPTSGTVTIGTFDIEESPLEAKALIGYLPENAPLYDSKTVLEFLRFVADLRGFKGKERNEKVENALQTCQLETVKHQSIDTLSKGFRHRTCFAQAILHDPELLILDEPTDGLDPNQKREMRNLIKQMGKTKAIIISTHILEEVDAVASRVLLINNGAKLFDGSNQEFKQLCGDANFVDIDIQDMHPDDLTKVFLEDDYVAGAELLKQHDNISSIRVTAAENITPTDLSKNLINIAVKEKWELIQVRLGENNLDAVFQHLTVPAKKED